jgi:hypothetical protein
MAVIEPRHSFYSRIAPASLILVLAPLLAEEVPGATRLTTLLAFPPILIIETIVWGGAALLLRALARRLKLGWGSLLLFGLIIAVAEEFVIQQTSFAPLVIHLKGVEWARAGGINYVYAIWALVYEAAWVVLFPTLIAEMVFPDRRQESWLNRAGAIVMLPLFAIGSTLAWFAWTQIARTKTFHVPIYNPSREEIAGALLVIAALFVWAIRFPPRFMAMMRPPAALLVGLGAAIWAILWYGLVLLAFGVAPHVSAPLVATVALVVVAAILLTLPRWAAHPDWRIDHVFWLVFGAVAGSALGSFVGFIGSKSVDLWFKLVLDVVFLSLLWRLKPKAA